jgi:hypothetical protein
MRTANPATASTLRTVSQVSTLATLLGARAAGTVGSTGAIDRTRQHELHHADGEAGVVTDGCESEGVPSGAGVLGPRGSSVAAAAPIGVAPAAAATMTRVVASRRIGYQIVVGMPISRRRVSRSKSASRRGVASALGGAATWSDVPAGRLHRR